MKNYRGLFLLLHQAFSLFLFSISAYSSEFLIVHITDTHEFFEKSDGLISRWQTRKQRKDEYEVISLSRVKALVNKLKKENPGKKIILVHSGDFLSPSSSSRSLMGADSVDILNSLGLSVIAIGNHEFDYGLNVLKERILEFNFEAINSNILDTETGKLLEGVEPFSIQQINDLKISFISAVTKSTQSSIDKFNNPIEIKDPVETLLKSVKEIRENKLADIIVALTHLTDEEDIEVAQKVQGIDLILGGHKHQIFNEVVNGVQISKIRGDGQDVNVVKATIEKTDGIVSRKNFSIELVTMTKDMPRDFPMFAKIRNYENEIKTLLEELIAILPNGFDATWDGMRETLKSTTPPIGEFIIDLLRKKLIADVGIINLGMISHANKKIEAGFFTVGDLQELVPLIDPPVLIELSLSEIKNALELMIEKAVGIDNSPSAMPMVSGLDISWDLNKPFGERVLTIYKEGSTSVPLDQKFRVMVNMYIYRNPEYPFLKAKTLLPLRRLESEYDIILSSLKRDYSVRVAYQTMERQLAEVKGRLEKITSDCSALLKIVSNTMPKSR